MNIDTAGNPLKVVLDTNVLTSALVYGGNSKKVLILGLDKKIQIITSPVLQAELVDIITKKFPLSLDDMHLLTKEMQEKFTIVHPHITLDLVRDIDDNRVLEAAVEGGCDFIITGDQDLLDLGKYKKIKIITPAQFLEGLSI